MAPRVPGTTSGRVTAMIGGQEVVVREGSSFRKPVCSQCKNSDNMVKEPSGNWTCMKCADEWLERHVDAKVREKSIGGVVLPTGTKDERRVTPSFRDIWPNHAARRAARKAGG